MKHGTPPRLDGLPIFGICGWSGSGKTTLLEGLVKALRDEGLRVATVKHDVHGVAADPRGKDSDRLFRAGADVLLEGPGETLLRTRSGRASDTAADLVDLAGRSDLVLVEGHKSLAVPKVWLLDREGRGAPRGVPCVRATVPWDADREAILLPMLRELLERSWSRAPLWGLVLMGGESRRMGSPKHLLPELAPGGERKGARRTWIERTVGLLDGRCPRVALAGPGSVPATLDGRARLEDAPDARGPMAGVLAAMRWAPRVSWLVVACDLPWLTDEALRWIGGLRRPGVWAALPALDEGGPAEPLLAYYDFRIRPAIERMAARGAYGLRDLAGEPQAITPRVPSRLAAAWKDADRPEDLH